MHKFVLIFCAEILENDPPYGAKVTFKLYEKQGAGWESPALKPWLEEAVKEASLAFFNKPHVCILSLILKSIIFTHKNKNKNKKI
jgi:hypothetical protein